MNSYSNLILKELPWAERFASVCASRFPPPVDREDLISSGIVGYLQAATRYCEAKGATFRGYCAVRIHGAVLDELRRWEWTPRSNREEQKRITSVTQKLASQLNRLPDHAELAAALGVTTRELQQMQARSSPRTMISLHVEEHNGSGDETMTWAERIPDPNARAPYAHLVHADFREEIRAMLWKLPSREAQLLKYLYFDELSSREVAERMGVSPSRISQLHAQALNHFRQMLKWERLRVA